MYDIKTINKALKILEQYNYKYSKVEKVTGIKRRTLVDWTFKKKNRIPLLKAKKDRIRNSKWSDNHKQEVIDYYFNHGESIAATIRIFGYPSRSMLKYWIYKDKRYKRKNTINRKKPTYYNDDDKIKIVSDFASRKNSGKEKANEYNLNRVTIYSWQKELTGETIMNSKKDKDKSKEELINEIKELKALHTKLEMENKILKKANELLKKEVGTNYSLLTNKEKTLIVSSLKKECKIKELILVLNIKKSTLFYELKKINFDKYKMDRKRIINIFYENYMCYGYRRIKEEYLKETGVILSEKVIRRIMKEEDLIVYKPKSKKYSSYKGEISPEVDNMNILVLGNSRFTPWKHPL